MDLFANWLAAPVVVPLLFAATSLLVATRVNLRQIRVQRTLALIASVLNLGVALLLLRTTAIEGQRIVLYAGAWQAPFGITMVADALSAIMLTLTALLMLAIVVYAMGTLDQREGMNFYPLLLFLLMGVNGAFLAGDLFNLYVFFEVLLMSSFVLLSLGGRPNQVNGGLRYVVLNLIASTVFLTTAGVMYGTLGTLNLAHLAERMALAPESLRIVLAGMLLIAYGSKAGLFPLFFWLPASYHTPHPAVTAIFGGLLTKVGIYALFRIYPLLFPELLATWQPFILLIAGLTMLTGVFGAMAVRTIRRVLSFHVISQVGYMVMGLGLAASGNELALGFGMAAGIFYIVHHMIVKTALLMAGGAAELTMGTGQLEPGHLGGLAKRWPWLAVIFFVAAFSLAGIPPSSGFVSKLGLLQAALDAGQWPIAAVSLLVSLLTLMSMVRLWQRGFAGPLEATRVPQRSPHRWLTLAPITMLVLLSLGIGIFSAPVFGWARVAAEQVLDRDGYIQAVAPTDVIAPVGTEH
ncbi:MAG: Na+/H+ antiporter subunit D [Anaerolineales bacterium]|nr:Na+/H+ antiporter subunit D [Anaerolineales bacterium]